MSNQDFSEQDEKSKTQIKKDFLALTKLGEELLTKSSQVIDELPLSDATKNALKEGQRIKHHTGLKRHLKYVGKLLRDEDAEIIQEILIQQSQPHLQEVKKHHLVEEWRDKILQQGDSAIFDLLNEYSHLDRQKLRQLTRSAQKEIELEKPAKYQRELFRYLRDNIEI